MVRSGQSTTIRPVDFDSRLHPDIPVEVVDRTDLIERMGPAMFARPERMSFTTLMLVRSGTGRHTIDFEAVPLEVGRLVRILPGQVHSWSSDGDVELTAVLSARPMPHATVGAGIAAHRMLDAASLDTAWALVDILRAEQQRYAGDDASTRLLGRLFDALHALYERAAPGGSSAMVPGAYAAFRDALEHDLGASHSVKHYARTLGYSERTLSRACHSVTGLSAKGILTQRLVLEAKRRLAHSDLPAATIGAALGFGEATNFHKFFVREVGTRPTEFRTASRTDAR